MGAAHHGELDQAFPSLGTFARPHKRIDRRRRQRHVYYEYYAVDLLAMVHNALARDLLSHFEFEVKPFRESADLAKILLIAGLV